MHTLNWKFVILKAISFYYPTSGQEDKRMRWDVLSESIMNVMVYFCYWMKKMNHTCFSNVSNFYFGKFIFGDYVRIYVLGFVEYKIELFVQFHLHPVWILTDQFGDNDWREFLIEFDLFYCAKGLG